MSQKNQFNIHESGDLPLGSNSDNLQVEQVKDTGSKKISKTRIRKAVMPTKVEEPKEEIKEEPKNSPKKAKKKSNENQSSSSIEKEDLEALNEQNIRQYGSRSRNKVIIAILVSLLVVAIAVIAIYAAFIRLENNCYLYAHGANATYYVDGEEIDKFRAPQSIKGNTTYVLDVDVKVNQEYDVKFKVEIYQSGKLLNNTLVNYDQDVFRRGDDGYYHSINKMSGNIDLFTSVIIDIEYKDTLNIDNFKMEVHTYFS